MGIACLPFREVVGLPWSDAVGIVGLPPRSVVARPLPEVAGVFARPLPEVAGVVTRPSPEVAGVVARPSPEVVGVVARPSPGFRAPVDRPVRGRVPSADCVLGVRSRGVCLGASRAASDRPPASLVISPEYRFGFWDLRSRPMVLDPPGPNGPNPAQTFAGTTATPTCLSAALDVSLCLSRHMP
jgi:hypothetical protein